MLFNKFIMGKELIEKAKDFATKCHKGQTRKFNGREYIQHPSAVAAEVEAHGGTSEMIAAAWLHDVVEDCDVKIETIGKMFGEVVAKLVDELTNPKSVDSGDKKTEYMAHKTTVMSSDGLTIKLCDRKNNTSDFVHSDPQWAIKYANKTRIILNAIDDSGRPLNIQQKKLIDDINKSITPYEDENKEI